MSRRYRPWRREQQFASRVKALTVTLGFDDPEPGPSFWADPTDDCGIGEPDPYGDYDGTEQVTSRDGCDDDYDDYDYCDYYDYYYDCGLDYYDCGLDTEQVASRDGDGYDDDGCGYGLDTEQVASRDGRASEAAKDRKVAKNKRHKDNKRERALANSAACKRKKGK